MVLQLHRGFMQFGVGQPRLGDYDIEALVALTPLQVNDLILSLPSGRANLDFLGFGSVDVDLVIAIEELEQPLDYVPFGFRHASVSSMACNLERGVPTRWRLTP